MDRRRFIRRGVELVIAVQCVPLLEEKAIALQPRSAKPPLTEASLNAIMPKDAEQMRSLARQAFPDVKAFIRGRFTLSAEQDLALGAISSTSVERIQGAVDAAIAKGATVSFTALASAAPTNDVRVETTSNAAIRIAAGGCEKLLIR
jgi:hypothetical protein